MNKKRLNEKVMKSLYINFIGLVAVLFFAGLGANKVMALGIENGTFNLKVDIPSVYKEISPGEKMSFNIGVLNLAGENRMDVSLEYKMINDNGAILASRTETMAIETQASFVGNLDIPESVETGDYELDVVLFVKGEQEAKAANSFKVVKSNDNLVLIYVYMSVGVLFLIFIIIYIVLKSKSILHKIRLKNKIHGIVKKRFQNS